MKKILLFIVLLTSCSRPVVKFAVKSPESTYYVDEIGRSHSISDEKFRTLKCPKFLIK